MKVFVPDSYLTAISILKIQTKKKRKKNLQGEAEILIGNMVKPEVKALE